MIISRAFYREAARATLMIVVALLVVSAFFGLTLLLARAARGDLADRVVLALLGLQTLRQLDLLLPLGVYLGVLLTFSRWYRDNEMTVLSACGVGIWEIVRPVLVFAAILGAVTAVVSFYLTPLTVRQLDIVQAEGERRTDPTQIVAGTFAESAGSRRILYAEQVEAASGVQRGVFAAEPAPGRAGVLVAQWSEPYVDARSGERFVAFHQGRLYDGTPGEAGFEIVDFQTFHTRLERQAAPIPPVRVRGMPTRELWRESTPRARAEWHSRLAKPVLVAVLTVMALVLAYSEARRGRFANLFAAILVYFIYTNLLGFGQALLGKGALPAGVGLWWVHVPFMALAAYFVSRRARHRPLLPQIRGSGNR